MWTFLAGLVVGIFGTIRLSDRVQRNIGLSFASSAAVLANQEVMTSMCMYVMNELNKKGLLPMFIQNPTDPRFRTIVSDILGNYLQTEILDKINCG